MEFVFISLSLSWSQWPTTLEFLEKMRFDIVNKKFKQNRSFFTHTLDEGNIILALLRKNWDWVWPHGPRGPRYTIIPLLEPSFTKLNSVQLFTLAQDCVISSRRWSRMIDRTFLSFTANIRSTNDILCISQYTQRRSILRSISWSFVSMSSIGIVVGLF
jgi:hypothetical protein